MLLCSSANGGKSLQNILILSSARRKKSNHTFQSTARSSMPHPRTNPDAEYKASQNQLQRPFERKLCTIGSTLLCQGFGILEELLVELPCATTLRCSTITINTLSSSSSFLQAGSKLCFLGDAYLLFLLYSTIKRPEWSVTRGFGF